MPPNDPANGGAYGRERRAAGRDGGAPVGVGVFLRPQAPGAASARVETSCRCDNSAFGGALGLVEVALDAADGEEHAEQEQREAAAALATEDAR